MNDNNDEIVIPEEDEPISPISNIINLQTSVNQLSSSEVDNMEKQAEYADRMDKHVYKKHGLKLMVGCIIGYGALVLFDSIIVNFGWKISSLAQGYVELLKFLVSTLIGFVFSETLKKDKH